MIIEGKLLLTIVIQPFTLPIDMFFRSLPMILVPAPLVVPGTGTDGTRGVLS